MAQGGRPIDSVWKFFIKVEDGGKIRAKCIKCSAMISAKAGRLRTHLEKCSQSELRNNFPKDDLPEIIIPINNSNSTMPPEPEKRVCHRIIQPKLNDFTIKTNSYQKEILDDQIARLFYACNLPFNLAENDVFKKTISMLRPGYTPPTRKSLAGGLLDKIFNEVTTMTASALEGKDVTLVQDGWSDIHNSPVIAHCVHTGERSYFLSSVDTGSNKKTATYCTTLAIEASKEATDKFGCKVVAVVTDNEYKMQSMRSKLKLLDSSLSVYGCASHLLNLLGKDITPSQVISHITEINKYFHNPGALLSAQKGSLKPQLPVVTRWNSQLECIKTYLTNKPFLLNILAQHEDVIHVSIVNLINNVGLYREAKNLYDQLKPISTSLDMLQGEKSNIADSCEEWMKLLQLDELKYHQSKIQQRFKQAITPTHFLANMINPKYMGQRLSCEQQEEARGLLILLNASLLPQLYQFQAKAAPFPASIFECTDTLDPVTWWKTIKKSKNLVAHELCDIAINLLILPSSSASIERIFSNFGLIQTQLRNRLGIDKASKLVACYRELRGCQELEW